MLIEKTEIIYSIDIEDEEMILGQYKLTLKEQEQIVLQFEGKNPNGSIEGVTAVCDESGLVCAMMPHPERASEKILGSNDGLEFFKGMLDII